MLKGERISMKQTQQQQEKKEEGKQMFGAKAIFFGLWARHKVLDGQSYHLSGNTCFLHSARKQNRISPPTKSFWERNLIPLDNSRLRNRTKNLLGTAMEVQVQEGANLYSRKPSILKVALACPLYCPECLYSLSSSAHGETMKETLREGASLHFFERGNMRRRLHGSS